MPDRRNWAKLAQSLIGKYSVFTYKSDRVLFEMSDPSSDTEGSAGSDCEYTETSDENRLKLILSGYNILFTDFLQIFLVFLNNYYGIFLLLGTIFLSHPNEF